VLAPAITVLVLLLAVIVNVVNWFSDVTQLVQRANPLQLLVGAHLVLSIPAGLLIATMWIAATFYTLDSLNSEYRNRSILFWKSLPVSDTVAVLSKFSVPMLVAPAIAFVATLATQLVLVLVAAVAVKTAGLPALKFLGSLRLVESTGALAAFLVTSSLWYAPVIGWLLFVSSWSRRNAMLWAALAPLALATLEHLALHTHHVGSWIVARIAGSSPLALLGPTTFVDSPDVPLSIPQSLVHWDLLEFATNPDSWLGLCLAAVFVASAIVMRRHRDAF
jgi:ABC-2 type transport system permease protein